MLEILHIVFPRDRRTLAGLNLALIFGILIACLWPFRAPHNTARWIPGTPGIDFGRFGVLLGEKPLTLAGDPDDPSATMELWLRPDPKYTDGSILSIYTRENSRQFNIGQWRTGLTIRSGSPDAPARNGGAPSYTPDLFQHGKDVFITITSGWAGTSVYEGGILQKVSPKFRMTHGMLSGSLVLGTAPYVADTWRGQIRGFAIYDRTLSGDQVQLDYASWIEKGRPFEGYSKDLLSAYLFDERVGRTVRNAVNGSGDLSIPEVLVVPEKDVLERPSFDDWSDIIANVIGFMPMGFVLCGYLMLSRRWPAAVVLTAVFCGLFSLALELMQVYLPTRDSSMMDVLTNLAGGTVGAFCYALALHILPSTSTGDLTAPARAVPKS